MTAFDKCEQFDHAVFSAFCKMFSSVTWSIQDTDRFAGFDVSVTAKTKSKIETYDVELKTVNLNKLLDYCFFEADKWYSLVGGENNVKLYFVYYKNLNLIAVWRVDGDLLRSSEKHSIELPSATVEDRGTRLKDVWLLPLSAAKIFTFDNANNLQKTQTTETAN